MSDELIVQLNAQSMKIKALELQLKQAKAQNEELRRILMQNGIIVHEKKSDLFPPPGFGPQDAKKNKNFVRPTNPIVIQPPPNSIIIQPPKLGNPFKSKK